MLVCAGDNGAFKHLKKKKEKPLQQLTLPTIQNCADASLTEKDLECANKNVSTILLSNNCVNEMRRGKYNSYTPKEQAKIGQYAAMYGATSAARYFIGVFSRDLNESTARQLKTEYLQQLKEKRQSGKKFHPRLISTTPTLARLVGTKHQNPSLNAAGGLAGWDTGYRTGLLVMICLHSHEKAHHFMMLLFTLPKCSYISLSLGERVKVGSFHYTQGEDPTSHSFLEDGWV